MKRINAILFASLGSLFLFFIGMVFNQIFTDTSKNIATLVSVLGITFLVQFSLLKFYQISNKDLMKSILKSLVACAVIFMVLVISMPQASFIKLSLRYSINSFISLYLIAYVEELIFRYFLQRVYVKYINKHLSIVLNSLLFTMIHSFNYDTYYLILVFIISVSFCYAYLSSKLFCVPVILHFTFNLISKLNNEFKLPENLSKLLDNHVHVFGLVIITILISIYYKINIRDKEKYAI